MAIERDDRTRMVLLVAAVLWLSALALFVVGIRLRMKPILVVGALDAMLALLITVLAVGARRRR